MTWEVDIENIGGILEGHATIEPGLNAVRASNWQGKSSFIHAIKAGLGVSTTLTEGAQRGGVSLRTPERAVSIDLVRDGDTVRREGRPYLTGEYDVVRANLFACLDEQNEVRQAVRAGESLDDILMRPLDFQNIDERIASLRRDRDQVETELAQAREARKRLPDTQERVRKAKSELGALRDRRDALAEEAELDATATEQSTQGTLAQARSEREQVETQIERLERSIERTESRLSEKRSALADVEVVEPDAIEAELAAARERLRTVKRDKNVLQSVYSATEMVLQERRFDLITDVERELAGDAVLCWICGGHTSPEEIEAHLEELGEKLASLRTRTERRRDEVERLEARREDATQAKRRERDLQAESTELEERLADHRASLEDARARRETLTDRIDDLSAAVDETVEALTDIESEIKYREAELKDVQDERSSLQSRADRVEPLKAETASLTDDIEALRGRKDEIKYDARDAFDRAMRDIFDRFDTGFEAARLTSKFELVVAREGREASLDALSEGELELLGFVTALAGYESFDVGEVAPVLLVDGVGGLADDNLQALVEYLQDRTEYLVFTVYPEYSSVDGTEIDPSEWDVATGAPGAAD